MIFVSTEVLCPLLSPPAKGSIGSCKNKVGSTCVFSCVNGYIISSGDKTRKCKPDGQWSGTHPKCSGQYYQISYYSISEILGAEFGQKRSTYTLNTFKDDRWSIFRVNRTSHMLQNMKLHKFAFCLKMSKYVHFLFPSKTKYLCQFVQLN